MPIEFLKKLKFLFEPARLKITYGGRGGGKTEGEADALSIFSISKKLRILCCREFQNSIAQSSYQSLVNSINKIQITTKFKINQVKEDFEEKIIKASDTFNILKTSIVSDIGSEFLFAGLRHNIESIKSLAKIDIAWTDEAREYF